MHVERRSGTDERRIVIAMITDAAVLGHVAARWPAGAEVGLFASPWANTVARWCCGYYTRFGGAPGRAIAAQYERWAEKHPDQKDEAILIGNFLNSLSAEYEEQQYASDYILDVAGDHFNKVKARRHIELMEAHLDAGNLGDCLKAADNWGRIELGNGSAVDVFQDAAAMARAFERRQDPLITYPGALGEFFGRALERDALIAAMAPEKRGKTHCLTDLAWQGAMQRHRTAYFSVGDLSEGQMLYRLGIKAARRPAAPGTYRWPTDIRRGPEDAFAVVDYREKHFDAGITYQEAIAALEEAQDRHIKSRDSYLRLSTHPNDSINVQGIRAIIDGWERSGWVADVVVVDYADILAPPENGGRESRDQINKTWKQLRALSQSLHALVITATQSDADSYNRDTLGAMNFSEDKRKYAHVNGMFAIGQTTEEKQNGIMRLNWIQLREAEFYANRCWHVAGCVPLGHPWVRSCA